LLSPTNFTKRQTLERNLKNLKYVKFYEDPIIALQNYISMTTDNVRDREFFGKIPLETQELINKIKRKKESIQNIISNNANNVQANEIAKLKHEKLNTEMNLFKARKLKTNGQKTVEVETKERNNTKENEYIKKNNDDNKNQTEDSKEKEKPKTKTLMNINDRIKQIEDQIKYINEQISFFTKLNPYQAKAVIQKMRTNELNELTQQLPKDSQEVLIDSIARYVEELHLRYKPANELNRLLRSLFGNKQSDTKIARTMQSASSVYLLASMKSSVKQLGEIGNSFYKNGIVNSMTSLTGSDLYKETGLDNNLFDDFQKQGKITKGALYFLNLFDKFGKNDFLRATVIRTQQNLEKADQKTIERIKDIFGNEANDVMAEFINYKPESHNNSSNSNNNPKPFSKNALSYLLFELSQIQPIHRGDKTQAYLDHPNYRFMYGLKNYFIKQISIFKRDIIEKAKHKETRIEAVRNLIMWQLYTILASLPSYLFYKWIFEDEDDDKEVTEQLTDVMLNNILLNNIINEYSLRRLKKNPAGFIFNQVTPYIHKTYNRSIRRYDESNNQWRIKK
jgi:hypothetical protein